MLTVSKCTFVSTIIHDLSLILQSQTIIQNKITNDPYYKRQFSVGKILYIHMIISSFIKLQEDSCDRAAITHEE